MHMLAQPISVTAKMHHQSCPPDDFFKAIKLKTEWLNYSILNPGALWQNTKGCNGKFIPPTKYSAALVNSITSANLTVLG